MKTSNERGSALPLVLMVLAVLTVFGIISTNSAKTEIICANADMQYKKAFYNAEAGLNMAIAGMPNHVDTTNNKNWQWTFNQDDSIFHYSVTVVHVIQDDKVLRWGDSDDDLIVEFNTSSGDPVELVTSTGYSNGANVIVESRIYRQYFPFNIKSALYTKGINLNGNGDKSAVYGERGDTTTCPAVWDIATPNTVTNPDEEASAFSELTDMVDDPNVPGSHNECHDDLIPYNLTKIVEGIEKNPAAEHLPSGRFTKDDFFGTEEEPVIRVIDGDASFSGRFVGWGIIVVKGDATFSGEINLHGLVITLGTTTYNGSGGDKKNIYGAYISGGFTNINGKINIFHDCSAFKTIENNLGGYKMLYWMEK